MPKEYYSKETPTTYMAQIHVPYAGKMTANDLGEVVKFLRDQATWIESHLIHLNPDFLGHQCSLGCQADPEKGDLENQPKPILF